ncbi:hypothetical protein ASG74_08240 [Knoellia sp. Soil729]|nr:hypothetical protein ASG74_08240 [Knoellia sp. Soil729]
MNTSDVQSTLRTVTAQWSGAASATGDNVATGLSTIAGRAQSAGHKTLETITLTDQYSMTSVYSRDGTVAHNGYASTTKHALDFAEFDLDVPDLPARISPQISSLSWKKRSQYADEPSILTVTVTDDSHDPVLLDGWWTNPNLAGSQGPQEVKLQPGIPTDVRVPSMWAGVNSLQTIQLVDGAGNGSSYRRDGTWIHGPGVTEHHLFDFSSLDLTLRPSSPAVSIRPRPFGARMVWHASGQAVDTKSSLRITVSPGGKVIDLPATSVGGRTIDVPGLANGTSYTVTAVMRSQWGDGRPTNFVVRPMPSTNVFAVRDASGDNRVDVVARKPSGVVPDGDAYVYPTNGRGAFGPKYVAFSARDNECERVAPADVQSDGEVLCFGPTLLAKRAPGYGYLLGTSGWSSMRFVDGGHDLTGDGRPDLVGVTADGVMKVYQTGSKTHIVSTTTLGSGWNIYTAVFQTGDFSGDRRADLVALDTTGRLWLYAGNGRGGFASRVQIGTGWGNFGAVLPLRDFNGDGKADIGAITMDGKLLMYPGNGRRGFLPAKQIGTGWGGFF